jgi:Pyruvate/2-oxoacid:ferredoxin oxidoreductase gamma subunit
VPIVNTALAGAVGEMLEFPLDEVLAALDHLGFKGANLSAATLAYENVRLLKTPLVAGSTAQHVAVVP